MNETNSFPEAGAVVNVDYKRTDGFVVKLTLRDATGADVLKRLDAALGKIVEAGGTPYEKSFGKFPAKPVNYVEGRSCPKCGNKLVHTETKAGQKFIKCSTNKWNFQLKRPEGCPFTEWPDRGEPNVNYAQHQAEEERY